MKKNNNLKLNILVYGEPGVGKTTFGTTAPNSIFADTEGGTKFLELRGLKRKVKRIKEWEDMLNFYQKIKDSKYETIVIDTIDELMEQLLTHLMNKGFDNRREGLSQAGWGVAKTKMKTMFRTFRDLDKHVILLAHSINRPEPLERLKKCPELPARLDKDLQKVQDIIGYLKVDEKKKRWLYVQPTEEYQAKDNSGCLPERIEPNFNKIYEMILAQESKMFKLTKDIQKTENKFEKDLEKIEQKRK